jgi:hypothetical protein
MKEQSRYLIAVTVGIFVFMTSSKHLRLANACLLLISMAALTGCSSLFGPRDRSALDNIDVNSIKVAGYTVGPNGIDSVQPSSDGSPCVYLEVNHKKRHMERIPMPVEQPMFIGDVIREAKLVDRVGRIDVVIVRATGPNQPPIRLTVDFDSDGKRVMEGQNYSLRPGDRVVVSKNTESTIDRVVGRFMPFAGRK